MAALNPVPPFQFSGRSSPLRAWDIRFRLGATLLVSTSLLAAPPAALGPLGAGVLLLLKLAGSTLKETARVVWGFAGFVIFFVGLGLLFEPTWTQAEFLGIQAARLTLLLLVGHVLFLAATPADVTEGIRWCLTGLGRRRAWGAANMASWALASVPLILDQASTLTEAALLRGHSARRHPLRAVKLLTLALLIRTVGRSTDLTDALQARSFGLSVPQSNLKAGLKDGLAFGGAAAWCAASWAFGSIVSP